jgi:hypothetical protein
MNAGALKKTKMGYSPEHATPEYLLKTSRRIYSLTYNTSIHAGFISVNSRRIIAHP